MDEPLETTLERLSRELHIDPHRTDLLIERIILHAVSGQLTAARSDLSTIHRLGVARGLTPALTLLACGHSWVLVDEGSYLLFDPSVGASVADSIAQHLRHARKQAERFFGPVPCRVVVELTPMASGLYHASYEAPGLGYFKLSPHHPPAVQGSLIAHEIAHLYLTSGNRFLDEGIALLFQRRCTDDSAQLTNGPGSVSLGETGTSPPFSLRALLAYDGQHDADFASLASGMDEGAFVAIRASAYRLAAFLLERLQLTGLQSLCTILRATPKCAEHPAVIATHLGEEIEAIDERLYTRPTTTMPTSPATHEPLCPSATPIWADLSPETLDSLITNLRHTVPRTRHRPGAKAALARAIARRALDGRPDTLIADVAELRSLVHELRIDPALGERERVLLEGWLALAETSAAPNAIVRIIGWERCLALFQVALARFPNDGEVLCATAAANLRGPVELGADRALARFCLTGARRLPGWTAIAERLECDMAAAAPMAAESGDDL